MTVTYRYPPELWTGTLTGNELITIDCGSVYLTQMTISQFFAALGNALPTASPAAGSGAIWNNNGFLCVA